MSTFQAPSKEATEVSSVLDFRRTWVLRVSKFLINNMDEFAGDPYACHLLRTAFQVWSLTQFYSVDFSKSWIGVSKCVFYKRTIKVCVSCC